MTTAQEGEEQVELAAKPHLLQARDAELTKLRQSSVCVHPRPDLD
jgi:hypothetical protein